MRKTMTIALLALAMALVLAACGDDGDDASVEGGADAVTLTGTFEAVHDAPKDAQEITGTAEQVRSDSGTEVSIQLSGLMPDTEYTSHVHAGSCEQPDPGGPHYKFDLSGSDMPPNEIHLAFTSDAEGNGAAQATNDQRIPDGEGMSVVVHLAGESHSDDDKDDDMKEHGDGHSGHTHMPKLACAQLS